MAKDYFQDIVPNSDGHSGYVRARRTGTRRLSVSTDSTAHHIEPKIRDDSESEYEEPVRPMEREIAPQKSIRNIVTDHARTPVYDRMPPPRQRMRHGTISTVWLGGLAAAVLVFFGGGYVYLSTRPSVVVVTPHTQAISFSGSAITAYPATTTSTTTDMLSYIAVTKDISDHTDVPQSGTTTTVAATRAGGSITVYNEATHSTLKLVKNTRFETPDGFVFRTTSDISVPGSVGTKAGSVTVNVVADQPGDKYNIGPVARMTIPGLKGNASLFANVYGVSTTAMSGGASANRIGVSDDVRTKTVADIKARIDEKVRAYLGSLVTSDQAIIPGTVSITYTSDPDQVASSSTVRLGETAHIIVPIFGKTVLAEAIAQAGGVDTRNTKVTLMPGSLTGSVASSTVNGTSPVSVFLDGTATVAWIVDPALVSRTLAGVSSVGQSFSTAIAQVPAIQEARATIAPFWSHTFPNDPSKIQVIILPYGATSTSSTH